MKELYYKIQNPIGLHMRPALKLSEFANNVESDITIVHMEQEVNAKSLLRIITLGITHGSAIRFVIKGEDEEDVLESLRRFCEKNEI